MPQSSLPHFLASFWTTAFVCLLTISRIGSILPLQYVCISSIKNTCSSKKQSDDVIIAPRHQHKTHFGGWSSFFVGQNMGDFVWRKVQFWKEEAKWKEWKKRKKNNRGREKNGKSFPISVWLHLSGFYATLFYFNSISPSLPHSLKEGCQAGTRTIYHMSGYWKKQRS